MYLERPRPLFIILWVFAAFIGFLAVKIPDNGILNQWMKFLFAVIAAGMALAGLFGAIEYMTWLWTQINQARYPIILASKLASLNPQVADIWEHHTDIEVLGMIGPDLRIVRRIVSTPYNVDWDFAQRYIDACRSTYPYTIPIGKAYEFTDWVNAERQATSLINKLADLDIVEKGAGNQPAAFKITWDRIAKAFEVEV